MTSKLDAAARLGDDIRALKSTERPMSEAFPDGQVPIFDSSLDALADRADALLAVVREVAEIHRPLAQHYHEAHCPRRFEEQHTEARHTESEYGGEYVCLDMPLGAVCEECRDEDGEHAEYPCPTATALASLTKEETDGR